MNFLYPIILSILILMITNIVTYIITKKSRTANKEDSFTQNNELTNKLEQSLQEEHLKNQLSNQKIEELKSKLNDLKLNLNDLSEENKTYIEAISKAKQELSVANANGINLEQRSVELSTQIKELSQVNRSLEQEITRVNLERNDLKNILEYKEKEFNHKEQTIRDLNKQFENKFNIMSQEILNQKIQVFNREQEKGLNTLLSPFKEQLNTFNHRLETVQKEHIEGRTSLKEQIKYVLESNQKISQEAANLTNALQNNKKQGIWGETILNKILETVGLQKGIHFETQPTLYDKNNNKYIPDVIIHLPQDRDLIIDSKVSLTAYERYVNSNNQEESKSYLKEHLQSITNHIKELSGKSYQSLEQIKTLDYVILFMPIESAYISAITEDNNLLNLAYKQRIIIATPSTLLLLLRTVENIWRIENQNHNAREIAKIAGKLHDKFVKFTDTFEAVGTRISQAKSAQEDVMKRLHTGRDNMTNLTHKLKLLGAETNSSIKEELLEKSHKQHIEIQHNS